MITCWSSQQVGQSPNLDPLRLKVDLYRAKTSLGVVSWPFSEVRLPCGIR
jgi:hypothetical protein